MSAIQDRYTLWRASAIGRAMNPDNYAGYQCKDVIDDYAQFLWAGKSWRETVKPNDAAFVFDGAPDEYWDKIENDPYDSNQLPQQGDVIVWRGWATNPAGHIAIVDSADVNGVTVVQQDGFAQTAAELKYWGWNVLPCRGWLRPKLSKPAVSTGTTRIVTNVDGVNGRVEPNTNQEPVQNYGAGDALTFSHAVRGADPYGNGNNIWFVGAFNHRFFWSGAFDNPNPDGLTVYDWTPPTPEPTPAPTPTPTPTPDPTATLSPSFEKELDCVTSVARVNITNYETDPTRFPSDPQGVVLHDFGTDGVDTLQSSLNHFKNPNTTAPHFVVSGAQIIQTGKLAWRMYHAGAKGNDKIGVEIDPDFDTNLATQNSVKKLLAELEKHYGHKLELHKHSEFMATSCGDDIKFELLQTQTPAPEPVPAPEPPKEETKMPINVPYKIRAMLYALTALGSPLIAYLLAKGIIGGLEVTLWSAEVAVVSTLAAFNTTPNKGEK